MNFLDMQKAVSGFVGQVTPSGSLSGGTYAKEFTRHIINSVVNEVARDWSYPWYRARAQIHIRPDYDTGTVTVARGDRTVTGAGTTWRGDMVGQLFVIGDDQIRIQSVASTTSLELEREIAHTASGAGQSYEIQFDMLDQPWDAQSIYAIYQLTTPAEVSSVQVMSLAQGRLLYDHTNDSVRSIELDAYVRPSIYSTGTVSVNVDATQVTGVASTWTSISVLEGDATIRFAGESQEYPISYIQNDTTLHLAIPYKGDTNLSGVAYQISPDRRCMRLLDSRDVDDAVIVEYEERPFPMYRDTDVCKVPQQYHFDVIVQLAASRLMAIKGMPESRLIAMDAQRAILSMRDSASVDRSRYGYRIRRVDEGFDLCTIPDVDTSRRAL